MIGRRGASGWYRRIATAALFVACSSVVAPAPPEDEAPEDEAPDVDASDDDSSSPWSFQLYTDVGYAASNNEPANGEWRSKSTTAHLDELDLFLAMGYIGKKATRESRWGFEFGMQAGRDADGLVPSTDAVSEADALSHLYRANVAYRFDAGRGVQVRAGLMNSRVGWESFLAIDNPNYTRSYGIDNVAYFLFGIETMWDVSEKVDLAFYIINGWNHLSDINDVPGYGLYLEWKIAPSVTFSQNLYYGPEQTDTSIEFWRMFLDSIIEWRKGRFVLAGVFDIGTEKQSLVPGNPRDSWASAVLIAGWQLSQRWSVALRPEHYWDRDGLLTAARQDLQAYTATVKYEYAPRGHRLVGALEVRYDRSTGPEGGFFAGSDNRLVPDQFLVLGSVLWSLDGRP